MRRRERGGGEGGRRERGRSEGGKKGEGEGGREKREEEGGRAGARLGGEEEMVWVVDMTDLVYCNNLLSIHTKLSYHTYHTYILRRS